MWGECQPGKVEHCGGSSPECGSGNTPYQPKVGGCCVGQQSMPDTLASSPYTAITSHLHKVHNRHATSQASPA